ncbi:RNB domain-containing ribonuclease [Streptomyces sp. KM273126]|uniref:RNB domain-containing ribonuclease n=1 Tax=Streptomyces sp. KM273126 TaxID=2545247 RepID=UPI0015EC252D|nr:RNB domain-containing ribonuclease [Streptomyces sp. KM273126]MBA2811692.1 RNB domain-containing ribonuclease [Streptomyces sp. KM273126]
MPRRHLRVTGDPESPLRVALRSLRTELGVPAGFPPEVVAEAERAERAARSAPPASYDATDIPFFTVAPPGSTDLDQALHLSRRTGGHGSHGSHGGRGGHGGFGGYRVRYAVADIAAFVAPGSALDAETHRRVTTLYFPDEKVPLHPPRLSEDAAGLLPERTRPAVLWTVDLDADGRVRATDVRRALVRSRARLSHEDVQKQIDTGTAGEPVALLEEIGQLRERLEVERGGISLTVPEQEIVERDREYTLTYRAPLPAEGWNAQISLLTGMAAADLMLAHGTGVLRTLPAAPGGAVGRLRRTAAALRVDWPHHVSYARLVRSLDPYEPRHAAFLLECTTLLRGAGYTVFRNGALPDITTHSAVAAPYAHCTEPLRRLVDRYTAEICLAAAAGEEIPDWVLAALDALPGEMAEGARRAGTVERACVDIVEAALLRDRVGDVFDGYVVDLDLAERRPTVGTVQLETPAVVGRIEGYGEELPLGERLSVRLTRADLTRTDPEAAKVLFAPA